MALNTPSPSLTKTVPSFLHALLQNRTSARVQPEPLPLLSTHQLPQVPSSVLALHSPDQCPAKGFTPHIPTSLCLPYRWSTGGARFAVKNTALGVPRSLSVLSLLLSPSKGSDSPVEKLVETVWLLTSPLACHRTYCSVSVGSTL